MVKKVVRMQKRRLLKLIALLEADAKNKKGIKFDIGVVCKPSDYDVCFEKNQAIPLDCGTTACAMGLAALSGKFRKEGLGFKIIPDAITPIATTWKGRERNYDTAAEKLFGISKEATDYLFSPWTYPYNKKTGAKGEREVVRRIKRVMAGKEISPTRY